LLIADALSSLIADVHWPAWWAARARVDGHVRALMGWADARVRARALRCVSRAYMTVGEGFVLRAVSGGEWGWEQLREKEGVGWAVVQPAGGGERVVVVRKGKRTAAGAAVAAAEGKA
jgi:hypothetical protein